MKPRIQRPSRIPQLLIVLAVGAAALLTSGTGRAADSSSQKSSKQGSGDNSQGAKLPDQSARSATEIPEESDIEKELVTVGLEAHPSLEELEQAEHELRKLPSVLLKRGNSNLVPQLETAGTYFHLPQGPALANLLAIVAELPPTFEPVLQAEGKRIVARAQTKLPKRPYIHGCLNALNELALYIQLYVPQSIATNDSKQNNASLSLDKFLKDGCRQPSVSQSILLIAAAMQAYVASSAELVEELRNEDPYKALEINSPYLAPKALSFAAKYSVSLYPSMGLDFILQPTLSPNELREMTQIADANLPPDDPKRKEAAYRLLKANAGVVQREMNIVMREMQRDLSLNRNSARTSDDQQLKAITSALSDLSQQLTQDDLKPVLGHLSKAQQISAKSNAVKLCELSDLQTGGGDELDAILQGRLRRVYGAIGPTFPLERRQELRLSETSLPAIRFDKRATRIRIGSRAKDTVIYIGAKEIRVLCTPQFGSLSDRVGNVSNLLAMQQCLLSDMLSPKTQSDCGTQPKDTLNSLIATISTMSLVDLQGAQVMEAVDFMIAHEIGHLVYDTPGTRTSQELREAELRADVVGSIATDALYPFGVITEFGSPTPYVILGTPEKPLSTSNMFDITSARLTSGVIGAQENKTPSAKESIFERLREGTPPGRTALFEALTRTEFEDVNHPNPSERLRRIRGVMLTEEYWTWH